MADEDALVESEVDYEEESTTEDPAAFAAALNELKQRCEQKNIPCEERGDEDLKYAVIFLPAGREKRPIYLFGTDQIVQVLSVPFEQYTFLGNYQALCSYREGKIVAGVRALGPGSANYFKRKVLGQPGDADSKTKNMIDLPRESNRERISIGKIEDESIALLPPGFRSDRGIAMKIEGLQISQHDQALDLLERLSNSLFFQIDLEFEVPLGLVRSRRPPARTRKKSDARHRVEIDFPNTEYDDAPISLYWYARGATGMPLLQFLAYYQSIEYYFPVYAQAEAQRKIRNILKDPSFRLEREADIGRILTTLRGGSFGFGDERSQLRATIQECLDPDQLRSFLTLDEKRVEFFSSKSKGLTERRIPIQNPSADLRNDVADRIYEIRCKIVHTKVGGQDGNVELLLPFSKEAELLFFDIELLQYVAQQVLIATSSSLSF
jgi:hypothetical protein